MKLLGLDHIGIVVRDIDQTVARAGETRLGPRPAGSYFCADIAFALDASYRSNVRKYET